MKAKLLEDLIETMMGMGDMDEKKEKMMPEEGLEEKSPMAKMTMLSIGKKKEDDEEEMEY